MMGMFNVVLIALLLGVPSSWAQRGVSLSAEEGRITVQGVRSVPTTEVQTWVESGMIRHVWRPQRSPAPSVATAQTPTSAQVRPSMRVQARSGTFDARVGWAFYDVEGMEALLERAALEEAIGEQTSRDLALEISRLPAGSAQRTTLEHALQAQLEAIFDLRQRNVLREIEILEAQLSNLRQQHEMRTHYKEYLVQRRKEALIGTR